MVQDTPRGEILRVSAGTVHNDDVGMKHACQPRFWLSPSCESVIMTLAAKDNDAICIH